MLNTKKHQTLKNTIVILIGLGLVMAYVPLLFINKNTDYGYRTEPQNINSTTQESVTSTVTTTTPTP